ncbi:metal ABC transporter permease [Cerasicoccus arenae]|uniref:Manganese ABC transporter permease n=1 Tax=Cerasicoccus arenae TaxID=424488 RepID=A0A8J3DA53_9BACT|nr:metal ABC transporter permease [Cerasicoccus arenae]MBK1858199.1 metal ABC transporter permease [Cerasicoccus arenae]GHC00890.1 manganese ABC transporter permease [Cerasicoccus arenae]
MIDWLLDPFAAPFMQRALLAAALAGVNCAVIGVYIVQRRMSFFGGALSHTVLPGMVFAFLRGLDIFWGALGAALATAFGVSWLARRREVGEDAAIGVVLSGMFALGVLMMSQVNSFRDFNALLFGSVLGVAPADLILTAIVTVIVLIAVGLINKELELASVDPEYARVIGARPDRMRTVLLVLTALSVVTAVRVVGALMATALLITPAAAALIWARSVGIAMLLASGIAAFSVIAGLIISYQFDFSSGASIVLASTACFAGSWLARAWRG